MDSQSMKFEFKITFVEISFIATEHGHPGSDEVGLFRYHRVPWPVVLWSVPQTPEIWAISWSWQPGETRKHSYGAVRKKTRCLMHIGNRSFVTGHFRPRHIHLSLVLRNQNRLAYKHEIFAALTSSQRDLGSLWYRERHQTCCLVTAPGSAVMGPCHPCQITASPFESWLHVDGINEY